MTAPRRIQIPYLGEYYQDELRIESILKNRTDPQEAQSLLCAKLMERTDKRRRMLEVLANKRGITIDELRSQMLRGEYEPLNPEELAMLDTGEEAP